MVVYSQVETDFNDEAVWYNEGPLLFGVGSCPLPVGPSRKLSAWVFTTA